MLTENDNNQINDTNLPPVPPTPPPIIDKIENSMKPLPRPILITDIKPKE